MIIKSDLELCKKDIQACVGRKVKLKTNGGRKRTIIHQGVIESCYPNVFIVRGVRENHDTPETVSFSYVDVLTQTVEIAVEPLAYAEEEIEQDVVAVSVPAVS